MFPRDMVCLRNISVDTLHKGDTEDNNNNNNKNNNNNNNNNVLREYDVKVWSFPPWFQTPSSCALL
jgi:hypothetical protein